MMLKWISEKLFPNDGDGNTVAPSLSPEVGAAGLLIEAAHRDSTYTEVEKDLATQALMKLFLMDNPAAVALRQEAEMAQSKATTMMGFASAARGLELEVKEALITRLWAITGSDQQDTVAESALVRSVIDVFGISQDRGRALKPAASPDGAGA